MAQVNNPLPALLVAHGITAKELGRRRGLDVGLLSNVGQGKRTPSLRNLLAIAEELHLDDLARMLRPWVAEGDDAEPVK